MREIEGLPRTAKIKGVIWRELHVENHKVVNNTTLFEWLLDVMNKKYWKAVLAQLISQGFKIGAVIEECMKDIKDPNNVKEILFTMNNERGLRVIEKCITLKHAEKIVAEIQEKLKSCTDWTDFYREFKMTGDFREDLDERIRRK